MVLQAIRNAVQTIVRKEVQALSSGAQGARMGLSSSVLGQTASRNAPQTSNASFNIGFPRKMIQYQHC